MWWNEVISAHDLCDTRAYLRSCDFTNVSADSMNNACPHEKKKKMTTPSTFSPLIRCFIKFTSSLLTRGAVDCACVFLSSLSQFAVRAGFLR